MLKPSRTVSLRTAGSLFFALKSALPPAFRPILSTRPHFLTPLRRYRSISSMTQKTPAPYGSWSTPITTDLVLASSISFDSIDVNPSTSSIFWIEGRPEEGGRLAIVYRAKGAQEGVDVLPYKRKGGDEQVWNARSRVHEYGGGSFAVQNKEGSERVVFSTMEGPAYETVLEHGGWSEPTLISSDSTILRYADFSFHPTLPNLVLSIQEDHTIDEPSKVVNRVVLLDTKTTVAKTVVEGGDFYSAPKWSPSGEWICYITWNHPEMPWSSSTLYVAKYSATSPTLIDPASLIKVAGGDGVSISQPRWSLNGSSLVFLSDESGFYELYSFEVGEGKKGQVKAVLDQESGKDIGGPDWSFAQSTHRPLSSSHWISKAPSGSLRLTDLSSKVSTIISTSFSGIGALQPISESQVLVIGTKDAIPDSIALITLPSSSSSTSPSSKAQEEIIKISSPAQVDSDYISIGKELTYPTKDGQGEAYAIWYPPASKRFVGVEEERPPLVVRCHGGPTSAAPRGLDWKIQFFTSRGFAFADVNYGGSTGYGRQYRARLDTQWGVVDVDDTIACVESLVDQQKVDWRRVAISGGSAGGFTVLAALCEGDVFKAGVSLYGISDLVLLAGDTHKFESNYLFGLLGGTLEEIPKVYHDRSPINNAANITAPLLILQGDQDRVVPPEQATKMAETIEKAGGKCEMIVFKGEGHGFRKAENKKKAFESELAFYRKTFEIPEGEEK